MIEIKFPDGKSKSYEQGISGMEIASSISPSLAKKSLAIQLDGKYIDLTTPITTSGTLKIITTDSSEGLEVIRHDAAHILAQALKEMHPEVQITIGPVIENGFYYDVAAPFTFSSDNLEALENKMLEIAKRNLPIERKVFSRDEAIKYFASIGENYKVQIIQDLPASEEISVYFQGDFGDLCRGPHAPNTSFVRHFKLLKVAGAYWRGDHNNEMLQRIYGTAWATKEQLDGYLHMLEEAEKRDHRKIGKDMDLFHFQDIAPGAAFWHPKGWSLFQSLIAYMRKTLQASGYVEINTPEVMDQSLWAQSGHLEKFGENMFCATAGDEERIYALKPMNCPGGVQVYKHSLHSYRDLPLRLTEFGKVHRYEPSGALHGLMRVRAFTQDDNHVFCTPEQLHEECQKICNLILKIYKDFGFEDVLIKFADRPEKRIGSDDVWDKAERALREAAESVGIVLELHPGEGAFYGPKLEFVLKDAIGRDWQVGTLQVDLNLPERLGAWYIDNNGEKQRPVMLHQANFGSLERFIGILIEHHAGRLPLWLSPTQVMIATITDEVDTYAKEVQAKLLKMGIRVDLDLENEKINYKIRKHSLAKVPMIIALGRNEAANASISLRRLGQDSSSQMPLDEFMNLLADEAKPPVL